MSGFNPVFFDRPKSIFPTMSALARQYDAVNLGQGFPDEDGPEEILALAAEALVSGSNQYAPVEGVPELRNAIATDNKRFYDLDINPESETLVVSGATEGLAACFLGLLSPGDEVIVFAPFYECYAPQIEAAGAKVVAINLLPPEWRIEEQALAEKITSRTKIIVLNSPHNPLGKVASQEELEIVSKAAVQHNLIVLCDEVYEHLVFKPNRHIPLMSLPGMRERTIRIGSAGKTFSVTGWRIGYVVANRMLIDAVVKAHQHLAYTTPAHLQIAVANAMAMGDYYYMNFIERMQEKRDQLNNALRQAGFIVGQCEGTYFLTVDIQSLGYEDDRAFCDEIVQHAKVAAIPISAFYLPNANQIPRNFVRFCFCKRPETIELAGRRLFSYINNR